MAQQLSLFQRLGLTPAKKEVQKTDDRIEFEGQSFEIIRKSRRRRISISIRASGKARVVVAKSTPVSYIKNFLEENSKWIQEKFAEFEVLKVEHPPKRFEPGEKLLFLGELHELTFVESDKKRIQKDTDRILISGFRNSDEVRKAIRRFYEKEARAILSARIAHLSQLMELKPTSLSFRCQKSRWGSCSSKGRISLNWRLLAAPEEVIDYVIIHELAHLRHPNHSENFWNLVRVFAPDFENHKRWLKKHHYELDFLSKTSELHAP